MKNLKRFVSAFCAMLIVNLSVTKSAKAVEPIITFTAVAKFLGFVLAVGSVWYAFQEVSNAKAESDQESILGMFNETQFPIKTALDPDIRLKNNKPTGQAYLVSVLDKPYADTVVKNLLAQSGVLGKIDGRFVIGIFEDQYSAQKFANIFNYKTDGDLEAVRSKEALNLDKLYR